MFANFLTSPLCPTGKGKTCQNSPPTGQQEKKNYSRTVAPLLSEMEKKAQSHQTGVFKGPKQTIGLRKIAAESLGGLKESVKKLYVGLKSRDFLVQLKNFPSLGITLRQTTGVTFTKPGPPGCRAKNFSRAKRKEF